MLLGAGRGSASLGCSIAALSTIVLVRRSSTRVVQSCTAVPTAPAQTFSDNVCVAYGDHEVSVDRRRSHRADVRRRRTRSPGSRLCHRQGPVGPLAARASTDCRSAAECA